MNNSGIMKISVSFSLLLFLVFCVNAQSGNFLKPADIFCDGAVIQRDTDVPIWGYDQPGKKVKVNIAGQELSATADKDGKWKVVATSIKAGGPYQLDIQSETGKLSIKDILCGEVWIMAGELLLDKTVENVPADAEGVPQLRYFQAPRQFTRSPYENLPGKWKNFAGGSTDVPALAYYFAVDLRKKMNVPVGVIVCSVPESLSHSWMSRDAIKAVKMLAPIEMYSESIQNYEMKISGTYRGLQEFSRSEDDIRFAGAVKRFQIWANSTEGKKLVKNSTESEQWQEKIQEWVENSMQRESSGHPVLEEQKTWPMPIQIASGVVADPRTSGARPSALFNGMISPLVPYAIKGFVFCEGQSDAAWDRGQMYFDIMMNLIKSWRSTWSKAQSQKKGDLPFIIMQLCGLKAEDGISPDECSLLRQSQATVIDKLNQTTLAVCYDIIPDVSKEAIKPEALKEAASRLATCAIGKFYSYKMIYSGPIFDSVAVGDGSLRLKFKYADNGLFAGKDGKAEKLKGFEIGNAEGVFKEAEATTDKNFVVIKTPDVVNCLRYGWGLKPDANLYNKEGLPAVPFTVNLTDK